MSRRRLLLVVLCLAWVLPGLVAHDPWKPDESYSFGIVWEMLSGGSWIAPTLAGEPFLRDPPLYYLSSALSAVVFSPFMAVHDAARLASGAWALLALLFCGLAARELNGPGAGALGVALLLGCFGVVVRAHQIVPQVATLAGYAMAYYGCARALRGPAGGLWLGTGLGIVFLAEGIPEAIVVALIALTLPLVSPTWRTRTYATALGVAVVAALPWLTVWPLLLHTYSPGLFHDWLREETTARLYGRPATGLYYLRILPWFAWPVWPLGIWALWRAFGNGPAKPSIVLPLAGLIITMLALSEATDKRELYALPLLVPLSLLATPGSVSLRRGAANAWYWFAVMGFTFFILVGWVYWSGLELGVPPRLHAHLQRLQPGYVPGFRWLPFVLGLGFSAAWVAVLLRMKKSPQRPAFVWAVGVTVVWGMLATLFIGWIDTGKSYRRVFSSLQAALPAGYRCVSSRDLAEPQRAMVHYYTGVATYRDEVPQRRRECDLLVTQGTPAEVPQAGWEKIWEGARPGDKVERYRLYRRLEPPARPGARQ